MTDARDVGFDSINIDNTHLMCNFALDVGEVERRFGNNFTSRRRSHMIRACS